MRLLVETAIESGLRWGELTELRVKDIDLDTGVLTVSRVVVQLKAKIRPDGRRFIVKDYPKDRKWRRLRVASHLVTKLREHIVRLGLGPDDLIFALRQPPEARRRTSYPPRCSRRDGAERARAPLPAWDHDCGCTGQVPLCARQERDCRLSGHATRRGEGRASAARTVDTNGHIGNDWFRANVWRKALVTANLGFHVTPHG
jgi:integrase